MRRLLTSVCHNLLDLLIAMVLLVLLPWTFVVTAQDKQPQPVKVEYDASKDQTQITLNPFILISRKHEELRLGAVAAHAGKAKTKPKEVILILFSLSATELNKYESARKLTVITENERFNLGETSRTKQVQNKLFIETMSAAIPIDDFVRVSRARQVTMKLGFTEVQLTQAQMDVLRIAASYMIE